jgi:predicted Zn-dependent peptidase
MVYRPAFVDVDSEREVVLEEIAMVEDTPNDLVHDIAAEAVFGAHPLGRPVIGTAHVISTVSRRALAAYHRRAYRPERIVLAAAGNVRHDDLVQLLRGRRHGASAPRQGPVRARASGSIRTGSRDSASSARTPSSTTSA